MNFSSDKLNKFSEILSMQPSDVAIFNFGIIVCHLGDNGKYIEIYDTSEDLEKDLRKYGELKSMGVLKSYDFRHTTLTTIEMMKMETIIKYINLDNMVKLLKYLLNSQEVLK